MQKSNILVVADSPVLHTGFATVSRNILKYLHRDFNVKVIGIDQTDYVYDQNEYPYFIVPNEENIHGDYFGIPQMFQELIQNKYNALFTINNLGITQRIEKALLKLQNRPKWVAYVPIEQDYLTHSQVQFLKETVIDILVLYHEDAEKLVRKYVPDIKAKIVIIPHGTNVEDFHPLKKKEISEIRAKYFNLTPDHFLITNLNRNQWRKNFFETILGFALLKQFLPSVPFKLYLHTKRIDQGGDIKAQIESVKAILPHFDTLDIIMAPDIKEFSVETVNKIYNASDLVVSTSYGEGWGLSMTEAMACKTPVMGPENTSFINILKDRGTLYKTSNKWVLPYGSSDLPRKGIDVQDFVTKIREVKMNNGYKEKIENGYKYVKANTWEKIYPLWLNVFNSL